MPAIKPPKFARPEVLRKLKPASLLALLSAHRDYLASRDVTLPSASADKSFDYDLLASVLMTPTESSPPELVEALEMIDLLTDAQSTLNFEEGFEQLVRDLRAPDDSAADLAVKILLRQPEIAWREADRRALEMKRSLVSYFTPVGRPLLDPGQRRLTALESLMSPWFADNARSGVCRVRSVEHHAGCGFIIRHGDLVSRMGVITETGATVSALFRPERLDVAFYNRTTGEWRISGPGRRLQDLYRKAFGKVLHGDAKSLHASSRYTLEPLRSGPDALTCDPDAAVQIAMLKALTLQLPDGHRFNLESSNVFAALTHLPSQTLAASTFVEARFGLKLRCRRRTLPLVVSPGRDCIAGATGEPAVESWLENRGFALSREHTDVLVRR